MKPEGNPLDVLAAKLKLRSILSPEDEAALLALPATVRTMEPSTYIVREGDPPETCGVLLSGFAYRQKLSGDGGRQIISVHIPGDMFDFHNLFLDVADHSVQMLTRGKIATITRARVQEAMRAHAGLTRAIMIDFMADVSVLREWILNVGRRNARARLAHLLCEVAVRLHAYDLTDTYGYELPMTQEQLADALGLTSVHVNRTLKALADEGIIRRSKRQVHLLDWERLREAGDFNGRYLHLEPQRTGVVLP